MLHTKTSHIAVFLFCLIFAGPSWGRADDTTTQSQDPKTLAVNQELDVYEGMQLKPGEVEKQFSNDQPDRPSPVKMLKDLLNPNPLAAPKPKIVSNVKTRVHTFDVGGEVFYYRHVHALFEAYPAEIYERLKEVGSMYGYYGNYTYRPVAGNFLNNFLTDAYFLQGRYATTRNVAYSGEYDLKNVHDNTLEFRGLVGKDYTLGPNILVTPYFGFGYRYLTNPLKVNSQFYLPEEKSNYYYLPLGGYAMVNLPKDWEMDINVEYDILLQGNQEFLYSGYPTYSAHQDHGFGVRSSVKFIKKGRVVDLYVEPYFRFWNIGDSKAYTQIINGAPVQLSGDTRNYTTEVGTKFGIQF